MLHLSCVGSGTPTVVLEAGLGEPGVMMAGWIQPGVATSTSVCVYDRAGKGWSEPDRSPQDGFAAAADLYGLLRHAQIAGPYIMAGHSSGGVYAQVFAERYPEEVAGMVLLDSQSPFALAQLPRYASFYRALRKPTALFPSLARFGVMRLVYRSSAAGLPPKGRAEKRAFWSTVRHNRSLREEVVALEATLSEAQRLKTLGDKPLVVVTAAKGAMAGWLPCRTSWLRCPPTVATGSNKRRPTLPWSRSRPTPRSRSRRYSTSSLPYAPAYRSRAGEKATA
jgi:pimeloyl-ACP methyl ester carboxylesterase